MCQPSERDRSQEQAHRAGAERDEIERFVASLTTEERLLVRVKAELYEGRWEELVADLEARLQGRPYILKLASRIEDDLTRIEKLRKFEQEQAIRLEEFC